MRIIFIIIGLIATIPLAAAQERMAYENRNQIDYGPLVVRSVRGRVTDGQGVPFPAVDIGVFTESGHELVFQTITDSNGHFRIQQLPKDNYRLVVHYDSFCPANARIRVAAWPKGGLIKERNLRVNLIPGGIDKCSWVTN